MANIISDETIEYVGILAKLELSPEEKEAARKDMAEMLDYIDMLNNLDTSSRCLISFRSIMYSARMSWRMETAARRFWRMPRLSRMEASRYPKP